MGISTNQYQQTIQEVHLARRGSGRGGFGAATYALVIAIFVVALLALVSGLGDNIGRSMQEFVDSLPLPT